VYVQQCLVTLRPPLRRNFTPNPFPLTPPLLVGTNRGVAFPAVATPGTIAVAVPGLGLLTVTADVFQASCDPARLPSSPSNTSASTLLGVLVASQGVAAGPAATAAVVNASGMCARGLEGEEKRLCMGSGTPHYQQGGSPPNYAPSCVHTHPTPTRVS
jgi:hypothetical protein